ncbi:ribonuclease H-like protein [Trametopsis cervina]|nr:ribonuclease H-like protein [Trametopsis cervina]
MSSRSRSFSRIVSHRLHPVLRATMDRGCCRIPRTSCVDQRLHVAVHQEQCRVLRLISARDRVARCSPCLPPFFCLRICLHFPLPPGKRPSISLSAPPFLTTTMPNHQTMYHPYAREYAQRSTHPRVQTPDTGPGEGIHNRKLLFCAALSRLSLPELVTHCERCKRWYVLCCADKADWYDHGRACHHYALVFTDGACKDNGNNNNDGSSRARAGIGGVAGSMGIEQRNPAYRWAVPVDDFVDGVRGAKRTSQRAELLAAMEGLRRVEALEGEVEKKARAYGHGHGHGHGHGPESRAWVVASDSECVVRGLTEWFPTWRRNGWRTSAGKPPANLDLFLRLDAQVTTIEQRGIEVGFWHIRREYNGESDELAKVAAEYGALQTPVQPVQEEAVYVF